MKFSALLIGIALSMSPHWARAGCSQNDSRLTNCDTALGESSATHVEIERENCVITATVFQPSLTGEPTVILSAVVTGTPTGPTPSGIPNSFKSAGFDLSRTDGTAAPTTGEFKAHLNAEVGSKKISEDLKCYL